MARIPRVRHVGYTADGVPIVRHLPDVTCAPVLGFYGGRQVGYTAAGLPVHAYTWACCDEFCTDAELAANTCYVEPVCYPHGPGPGIQRRLTLHVLEVTNCVSVRRKKVVLEYDAGSGRWLGSLTVRDKTADFQFVCNGGLAWDDPGKFTLIWSGCESGSHSAGATCQDPLRVDFAQIPWNECCDCTLTGPPATDVTSVVSFVVVGNCQDHPGRTARHVGYTAAGVPVVAQARTCDWDLPYDDACTMMRCGIVAEVSATGDCACMDGGLYDLGYEELGGFWTYSAPGPSACGIISMGVTCTDLENGLHRLTVSLSCDEYNTGTGFVDVTAEELEDLDVSVPVTMTWAGSPPDVDPAPHCCTGTVFVRLIRP